MNFSGKTVFVTGGSRGIGLAIAEKLAKEGANIAIAAKSVTEQPTLAGTIYTAAKTIEAAGGKALPLQCDIRHDDQVAEAVQKTVDTFGGIDILLNNASAINLSPTDKLEMKRYDLMMDINVRGTFLVTQTCLPHLKKSTHAHILTLSPPLNIKPKWLKGHVAYSLTKFNMSMLTLGWAAEFAEHKIGVNALWPRTTIDTAAVRNLLGGETLANMSRTTDILADAAYYIFSQDPATCTGNLFIDEEVMEKAGVLDLSGYSVQPGATLYTDLFVDAKKE